MPNREQFNAQKDRAIGGLGVAYYGAGALGAAAGFATGVLVDQPLMIPFIKDTFHWLDVWSHTWNTPPIHNGKNLPGDAFGAILPNFIHNFAQNPILGSASLFCIYAGYKLLKSNAVKEFFSLARARGR